jgi:hypothetical protein
MNSTNLRILQLNTMKSRPVMEALINDQKTNDIDILLIQEPPVTAFATHVNHSRWRCYQPTCSNDTARKRSLMYIHHRIPTSTIRQIPCNSPDVAAMRVSINETQILIFSVYIPPVPRNQSWHDTSIQPALEEIQKTIQKQRTDLNIPIKLILAGDLNRHHPMWAGRKVHPEMAKHANELLATMQNLGLSLTLPPGTPTYWSLSQPGKTSTLDLTLTDMPENVLKCHLYHDNYGSDHRATYSEWNIRLTSNPEPGPRKLYEKTDWTKVGRMVQMTLPSVESINDRTELEQAVQSLIQAVTAAVDYHTPLARPSPYSKRS